MVYHWCHGNYYSEVYWVCARYCDDRWAGVYGSGDAQDIDYAYTEGGCHMLPILSSMNCISLLSSYIASKYLYTPYITGGVEAISATVS